MKGREHGKIKQAIERSLNSLFYSEANSYFKNASANTALCIWRLDVVPVLPQKASYTACVPATLSKYLHVDVYACIFSAPYLWSRHLLHQLLAYLITSFLSN